MKLKLRLYTIPLIGLLFFSCSSPKSLFYSKSKVPMGASIGVIIDSPNDLKNITLISFMRKGFRVKAFNSSDLYTMKEIFDIVDLKRISYEISNENLPALSGAFSNAYKLHIYNFELHKAEYLSKISKEWKVDYLVLLDLKNWESVSWARVINLRTMNLEYIENYPTKYNDNIESIVDHFISNISGI